MGYIKTDEILDLFLISAKLVPVKNESSSNLINGDWFIQTIGKKAEKLDVKAVCRFSVVEVLQEYADTKGNIEIGFLDFVKRGFIIDKVDYDFITPGSDPRCEITFELAVIPNV